MEYGKGDKQIGYIEILDTYDIITNPTQLNHPATPPAIKRFSRLS